jgi:hypothetical protein
MFPVATAAVAAFVVNVAVLAAQEQKQYTLDSW